MSILSKQVDRRAASSIGPSSRSRKTVSPAGQHVAQPVHVGVHQLPPAACSYSAHGRSSSMPGVFQPRRCDIGLSIA